MGQADSQFKAFIRFILDDIKDLQTEADGAKKAAKIEKIIDNLQKPLRIDFQNRKPAGHPGRLFLWLFDFVYPIQISVVIHQFSTGAGQLLKSTNQQFKIFIRTQVCPQSVT